MIFSYEDGLYIVLRQIAGNKCDQFWILLKWNLFFLNEILVVCSKIFLFVFGVSKIGVCIQNAFLQIAAFVSLFSRQKLLQAMWFSQNAFFLQEKEGDKAKLSNCTRVPFFPHFAW